MHRAPPAVRDDATPCKKPREMELIGCIQLFQIELRCTPQRSLPVDKRQANGDGGAQNDSPIIIGAVMPHSLATC